MRKLHKSINRRKIFDIMDNKQTTYNESKKRASLKYEKTLKAVTLRVKPDYYDNLKKYADYSELSVRAFILTAIDEKIRRIDESAELSENDSGHAGS